MIKIKQIFVMLLFALMSNFAAAQTAQNYNSPDFYRTVDPYQWEWGKVNWNLVDFDIDSLYFTPEFYKNLPANKYGLIDYRKADYSNKDLKYNLLDYRQVDYLLVEHNRVDARKYFSDLGCKSCSLNRNGRVPRFKLGSIENRNGAVSIPGNYPAGTLFVATFDGIEAVIPKGKGEIKKIKNPDRLDRVTIDSQDDFISLEGAPFNLIRGKLDFKDGEPIIMPGKQAVINLIEIKNKKNSNIRVFLDGKKHDAAESYFSSDYDTGALQADSKGSDSMVLTFHYGNPTLDMEFDDFALIALEDYGVSIDKREKQELIPLVTLKPHYKYYGSFAIASGKFTISGSPDQKIKTETKSKGSLGSSPMSIVVQDASGKNSIGTQEEPKKLVITNFNEIGTIPLNAQKGYADEERQVGKLRTEVDERLYSNYDEYNLDKLEALYPGIEFNLLDDSYSSKKLIGILYSMPNDLVDSIGKIEVIPDDKMDKKGKTTGAYTTDRTLHLRYNVIDENTIYHEAGHTLMRTLQQENEKAKSSELYSIRQKLLKDFQSYADANYKRLGVKVSGINPDTTKIERVQLKSKPKLDSWEQYELDNLKDYMKDTLEIEEAKITIKPFTDVWGPIAGDVYGKGLGPRESTDNFGGAEPAALKWADGTDGPRNGCVRAYGCNTYLEDISEFIGKSGEDPSFFRHLISKTGSKYDKKYLQKLAFLNNIEQNGKVSKALPNGWLAERMRDAGYAEDCIKSVDRVGGYKAQCIQ